VSREPFPSFCRRCCCRRRRRRSIIFCRRFTTCIYFRVWDKQASECRAYEQWLSGGLRHRHRLRPNMAVGDEWQQQIERKTRDEKKKKKKKKVIRWEREGGRQISRATSTSTSSPFTYNVQGWRHEQKINKIAAKFASIFHRFTPFQDGIAAVAVAAAALVQMLCKVDTVRTA
jgi:hypothetical protein